MLTIHAPTPTPSETPIDTGAFWPTIEPAVVRERQRIDNTITPNRLRGALIEAIASTNAALAAWRRRCMADGVATLAEVEAEQIDGKSILEHRYQRAVGSLAKALLLERYRDFDATGKGDRKADSLEEPIDGCRRDHLNAVADIAGRQRLTVELI